jgi:hypothetical protein
MRTCRKHTEIRRKRSYKRMPDITFFSSYSLSCDAKHFLDQWFSGKWVVRVGLTCLWNVNWQCWNSSSTWRSKLQTNSGKLLEPARQFTMRYLHASIETRFGHLEQFLWRQESNCHNTKQAITRKQGHMKFSSHFNVLNQLLSYFPRVLTHSVYIWRWNLFL